MFTLATRWTALAPSTHGLAWFLADQGFLIATFVPVKLLGAHHQVFQVVFMRLAVGFVVLLPTMVRIGPGRLASPPWRGHCRPTKAPMRKLSCA